MLPDEVRFTVILSDEAVAMPACSALQGVLITLGERPLPDDPPMVGGSFDAALSVAQTTGSAPLPPEEAKARGWPALAEDLRRIILTAGQKAEVPESDRRTVMRVLHLLGRTGPGLSATLLNGCSQAYLQAVLFQLRQRQRQADSPLGPTGHAAAIEGLERALQIAGCALSEMGRFQEVGSFESELADAWRSAKKLDPSWSFAAEYCFFAATGRALDWTAEPP